MAATHRPSRRRVPWRRGYVQVYHGTGKGKTTAALGLALRAAGAGFTVLFAQFLKGAPSSEMTALKRLSDRIHVRRYGTGRFIRGAPAPEDNLSFRRGLADVRKRLLSGRYKVVILDEVALGVHFGIVSEAELLDLIAARPEDVELVITGRIASNRVRAAADLVTEMRERKHYFRSGVLARKGIED